MNRLRLSSYAVALIFCLVGCSSSGPKTEYYSLFASNEAQASYTLNDQKLTFGIGRVRLPEYLDTSALVSADSSQQRLRISGRHAWAGGLEESISRVLADELANQWQLEGVWAFPWDNRIRPQYQINIVIERFIGERGGDVILQASWSLQNKDGKLRYLLHKEILSEPSASISHEDYVAALNSLLLKFAEQIAKKTQQYLSAASPSYP